MFDLERAERYIIIALTVALLLGSGAIAYKRSRAPAPVRVEKFTVPNKPLESSALKININKADAQSLAMLDGVGPAIAARIIEYRASSGPFLFTEDIRKVRGVGPSLYDKIKDHIVTE